MADLAVEEVLNEAHEVRGILRLSVSQGAFAQCYLQDLGGFSFAVYGSDV